jgi:hypothetical protein
MKLIANRDVTPMIFHSIASTRGGCGGSTAGRLPIIFLVNRWSRSEESSQYVKSVDLTLVVFLSS